MAVPSHETIPEPLRGFSWKLARRVTEIWQTTYGKDKAPRCEGTTPPPILSLGSIIGVNDELHAPTTLSQGKSSMYVFSQEDASAPATVQTRRTTETSLAPTTNRCKLPPSPCAKPMGQNQRQTLHTNTYSVCGGISSCTVSRNTQERSRNNCCRGKALRITYYVYVCVCSLRYPACKAHAQYHISFVACVALSYLSPLSHTRHDFREGEKGTKHNVCAWFYLHLLPATFLIVRSVQRYIIIHVHWYSCKAPVILVRS